MEREDARPRHVRRPRALFVALFAGVLFGAAACVSAPPKDDRFRAFEAMRRCRPWEDPPYNDTQPCVNGPPPRFGPLLPVGDGGVDERGLDWRDPAMKTFHVLAFDAGKQGDSGDVDQRMTSEAGAR